ncbi:MAG: transcriptional regulator [gamma proteobacterium symbiont of Ctena orbiculata]|uniref:Transcriptional regulator n=1 Tax=Candidatus Thiodiazotropha taylori TaxID=2792791 RepID=A0A944M727_9GAMM|nr:transcriptional regulator [Candidatus Thiodiazotropha taylori]PUB83413.1 MAG: transcriptional regulator [gamma proteobacterium symbiont of Ctena orbiculata]MBT2988315.1 transcriptional regulator [Candidatus Thiodiazotropha taylori]MBT2998772.1 transcriptional regulator [Candidatus Thiodiazotropha taylori]MBT2999566.1 transcriptional regulator [Candidatus Thiodiazotropha taylori]
MLIEGPLKIGVLDDPEQPGRELHIDFTPEFQALEQSGQAQAFADYLRHLGEKIATLAEGDPNRAGMLIIQQIAEQLLPHLQQGELEISQTIVVEMGRDYASDSLMGLLSS